MKKNKAPYLVIAIICVFLGIARSSIMEEWPWYAYVGIYFFQVLFLIGVWELIQVINKKLEKFYSFEESPVTRIALQVLVSVLLFLPMVILLVNFFRPYMPSFVPDITLYAGTVCTPVFKLRFLCLPVFSGMEALFRGENDAETGSRKTGKGKSPDAVPSFAQPGESSFFI
jgi:hypothetical protein